jgi:hypothetical protein
MKLSLYVHNLGCQNETVHTSFKESISHNGEKKEHFASVIER